MALETLPVGCDCWRPARDIKEFLEVKIMVLEYGIDIVHPYLVIKEGITFTVQK